MISFFSEDIDFEVSKPRKTKAWLRQIVDNEQYKLNQINYIFCSDEYLLGINQTYLNHDYYTDIITFNNAEKEGIIEGDIFISIDRVSDNAKEFGVLFDIELKRILAHGLLHLIGYDDTDESKKSTMREKENFYLSLY